MEAMRNQLTQLQNLIAHTASACNGEVLCSHDFRKAEQVSFCWSFLNENERRREKYSLRGF